MYPSHLIPHDLIIKFRTAILTAFVAITGAIFAIAKLQNLDKKIVMLLCSIPLLLWVMAFIIDFFYYRNLLLGSVKFAEKFDKDEKFKNLGLFGLTECISNKITERTSNIIIFIYYILPIIYLISIVVFFHDKLFN